ncbi:MAG: ABC transporter ATP-binding protein [Candidatus Tectomicrobia bacterium]|nr:ABC transporter ATP-binding protein [Candidatus Tectomicrobia bacterium]
MLQCEALHVFYGHIEALKGVSFEVREGEIVTLIGANGAGKSTILKTVSGLLRARRGSIAYLGEEIQRCPADEIVRRGIAQAPEGRRVFPGLTVEENLEVATASWRRRGEPYQAELEKVYHLFPALRERRRQLAWSLSGGEQQMLAIGRSLMARPKLLLLDEPSLGLAPMLVQQLFATIGEINRQGVTILLVEQNAFMALRLAHRGYVLENGVITLADEAARLVEDPKVKAAYLGG